MKQPRPRPTSRRLNPQVESCEPRRLLATFVVTTAADNGSNTSPTPGSLRAEILLSNASPAPSGQTNLISFDISGSSTIEPPVDLPAVTAPAEIDGFTQPGTPVVLDGSGTQENTADATTGLEIAASGSLVEGLTIDQFGTGLYLYNSSNNQILQNKIGTDPTGETSTGSSGQSLGNTQIGLSLYSSSDNIIGGNVISGNRFTGIEIDSPAVLLTLAGGVTAPSLGNTIENNEIGTDADGAKALPNQVGIELSGSSSNTIGGTAALTGNVISGNTNDGVLIDDMGGTGGQPASDDDVIEGNKIGTDATGTKPLGDGVGVSIEDGVEGNTVGGTVSGSGNIISDNIGDGVYVSGPSNLIGDNTIDSNGSNGIEANDAGSSNPAQGLEVENNLIGTNAAGSTGLGNVGSGILVDDGSLATFILDNVISGSLAGDGVDVESSTGTNLTGDLIGTDPTGTLNLGNDVNGVLIINSPDTSISGSVIVGSKTGAGVKVEGTSTQVASGVLDTGPGLSLTRDHVGVNLAGTAAIPNAGAGVVIDGPEPVAVPFAGGSTTEPADPVAIEDDVISGNTGDGVQINSVPQVDIENSQIGTNAAGTAAIANGGAGIDLGSDMLGLSSLTEPDTIKADVISGNTGAGILADAALGTQIAGNIIGTGYGGNESIPDGGDGIDLEGACEEVSITGNQVVNNKGDGIGVHGSGGGTEAAANTYIAYNEIGTLPLPGSQYATGMGNLGNGMAISNARATEVIGNVIDSNGVSGVASYAAVDVYVEYNWIGIDPANNPGMGNRGDGIQFTYTSGLVQASGLIQDNAIGSNGTDGIALLNSSDNTLFGNFIGTDAQGQGSQMANQGNGLSIVSDDGQVSTNDSINSNTILANGGNGVEVEGVSEDLYFNMNRIGGDLLSAVPLLGLVAGNGKDGVLLEDVTAPAGSNDPSVVLTGNEVDDNNLDGLQVIGGGSVIVTADTFYDNIGDGVEFDSGATNDALNDDFVLMNQAFGVLLSHSSNITLTGVTIDDNGDEGLAISDSTGIVIKGGTDDDNDQKGPVAVPG